MKLRTLCTLPLAPFALCFLFACDKGSSDATTHTTSGTVPADNTHTTSGTVPADNTQINQRDRQGPAGAANGVPTPIDQGNDPADLAVSQRIRQALMGDNALSVDAKNVKVITANGVITLRGPVKSDAERERIASKALSLAGANRVDDELDVEANK